MFKMLELFVNYWNFVTPILSTLGKCGVDKSQLRRFGRVSKTVGTLHGQWKLYMRAIIQDEGEEYHESTV